MASELSSPVRRAFGELKSTANGERAAVCILLHPLSSPVRRQLFGERGKLAHCSSSPVRHTRKGGERRACPARESE
jgi:hypothetical protein